MGGCTAVPAEATDVTGRGAEGASVGGGSGVSMCVEDDGGSV